MELDLDAVLPFAALSENGRDVGGIDSKSELAHRLMLTNLVRLLGAVKEAKEMRSIQVLYEWCHFEVCVIAHCSAGPRRLCSRCRQTTAFSEEMDFTLKAR